MGEVTHGSSGYRQGCRCSVCKAGQAERLRKTSPDATRTPPGERGPGVIEMAVATDLDAIEAKVPLSTTLKAVALECARRMDRLDEMNRPDLFSPLQQRLMDALHELAGPVDKKPGGTLEEALHALSRPQS